MNDMIDIDVRAQPKDQPWSERQGEAVEPASAAHPKPRRLALLAHCGTGNLGDEASLAAVLDNIRRRSPLVSIVGLSMHPEDTRRRHGIPCFAMRQRIFPFEREWS